MYFILHVKGTKIFKTWFFFMIEYSLYFSTLYFAHLSLLAHVGFLCFSVGNKISYTVSFNILRYSDILVHRLLAVAIGAIPSFPQMFNKQSTQVKNKVLLANCSKFFEKFMY